VLVLDRTVMRVLADGTQLVLTHNIVNVKTKDGIARWGEIQVPTGAEILALRTHKADGSTREPEEISGKETVSAPDLAPGDFVEWETLEADPPADAFAPGFIGDRFYFQSVELPLHLSEMVLVVPPELRLELDARAGAPPAVETRARDGARVVSFTARQMPQLFAERAAVPPLEWIPSVRASAGLTAAGYVRNVRDGVFGLFRSSPALRAEARRIADALPGAEPRELAAAIVRRVVQGIEPEANLYESATATLARGRGNRAALMVALARVLGLDAQLAFVRPRDTAPADAPIVAQQIEDFSEVLVRFADKKGRPFYVEPSLEHAAFGYLAPRLDGALALLVDSGGSEIARGNGRDPDLRDVTVKLRLDAQGQAAGDVIETLRGWPAIEWASFAKQTADDPAKRRQEFEQRWLGQQFPGARLGGLAIDVDPRRPGEARLRYNLSGLPLGNGGEGRIPPSFFRVAAGRRYANLKARRTDLQVGPEVPMHMVARITLPAGTKVSDVGRSGKVEQGPISFSEDRRVLPGSADTGPTVELTRSARLPLLRVPPAAYQKLAPALRRMDALERAEIQFTGLASPAASR
jgi:transglutaminase-like putative cysteine protease